MEVEEEEEEMEEEKGEDVTGPCLLLERLVLVEVEVDGDALPGLHRPITRCYGEQFPSRRRPDPELVPHLVLSSVCERELLQVILHNLDQPKVDPTRVLLLALGTEH